MEFVPVISMYCLDLKLMVCYSDVNMLVAVLAVNNNRYKKALQRKIQRDWGGKVFQSKELGRLNGHDRDHRIDIEINCFEFTEQDTTKSVNVSSQGKCSFLVHDVLKDGGKAYKYLCLEMSLRRADLQLQCEATSKETKCGGSWRYRVQP